MNINFNQLMIVKNGVKVDLPSLSAIDVFHMIENIIINTEISDLFIDNYQYYYDKLMNLSRSIDLEFSYEWTCDRYPFRGQYFKGVESFDILVDRAISAAMEGLNMHDKVEYYILDNFIYGNYQHRVNNYEFPFLYDYLTLPDFNQNDPKYYID